MRGGSAVLGDRRQIALPCKPQAVSRRLRRVPRPLCARYGPWLVLMVNLTMGLHVARFLARSRYRVLSNQNNVDDAGNWTYVFNVCANLATPPPSNTGVPGVYGNGCNTTTGNRGVRFIASALRRRCSIAHALSLLGCRM